MREIKGYILFISNIAMNIVINIGKFSFELLAILITINLVGREIDKETNNVILTDFPKREDYINYMMHKKKIEESSYDDLENIINFKDNGILNKHFDSDLNKSIDFNYERIIKENKGLRRSLNKKIGQQTYVIALLLIKICYDLTGISIVEENNYSIFQRLFVGIIIILSSRIIFISRKIFYSDKFKN